MRASKRRSKRNQKNAMIIGGVAAAVSAVAAGAGAGIYAYSKKKSHKVTDTLSDVTDEE